VTCGSWSRRRWSASTHRERVEEHLAAVLQPPGEVSAGPCTGTDRLRGREAFRVLLEALGTEQFAADQIIRTNDGGGPEFPKE